jgi:hypothetical protein
MVDEQFDGVAGLEAARLDPPYVHNQIAELFLGG